MTDAPASPSTRVPRWISLALVAAAVALWALDTHRPPPWPEAASAWFAQARALTPASQLIDRLHTVVVTPDLPVAPALLLLALGAIVLAIAADAGVPAALAVATAVGVMATRSAWSTVTPGSDAAAMVAMAAVVLAVSRPRLRWVAVTVLALSAPWLALVALPAVARRLLTTRSRLVAAVVLSAGAVAILLGLTWRAVSLSACGDDGLWRHAVVQILVPGVTAQASAWMALRQATAVFVGDVHLFGVAVAAFGLTVAPAGLATLRWATLGALLLTVAGVAIGLLPPAVAAAALLPWWAPWAARGGLAVVDRVPAHQRRVAMALVVGAAAVIPLLRHATPVPGPWVAGMPATTRVAASGWHGIAMATDDAIVARRWRAAGIVTVPADAPTIAACLARHRPVGAAGSALDLVEALGFTVDDRALLAPVAAVLTDLRADQLVALAVTGPALPYLGPPGVSLLGRLGADRRGMPVASPVAALARTDVAGRFQAARDGTTIDVPTGEIVGARQLAAPLSVDARADRAGIGSASQTLVTSRVAALAVFDRAQEIVMRAAGSLSPGVPVPLSTIADWRHATVTGTSSCASGPAPWLELAGSWRVSASLAAASPRRPLIAYAASPARPRPGVAGLPLHPVWREWTIEVVDPADHAAAAALAARARTDGFDGVARRPGAFWTRLEVAPRDAWHAARVTLVAGTRADWWVAPPGARGAVTRTVCRLAASGDRLLLGQYGAVDDESAREIAVRAVEGWHAPERLRSVVHQWSAQPDASVGFRLPEPVDLVLVLDASPARAPLRLAVNGTRLHGDWSGAGRLAIPAALLGTGENMLTLSVPEVVRPDRDPRALGVLVRQFRLVR